MPALTTVRELVAAAGVTKPVLYYYFGSKEGLYLEIMNGIVKQFDQRVEELEVANGTVRQRLVHFFAGMFAAARENLPVVRLAFSIYYGPPQGAPFFDFEAYHEKFFKTVLELVKQGIKAGEFWAGNAEYMAWAVIAAISLANELELAHPDDGLGRRGLARVLKLVLRGIVNQRPKTRVKRA